MGHAVAHLFEAVCYNQEGRGFYSTVICWEFFIDVFLPTELWPWGRLNLKHKRVPGIFPEE